MDGDRERERERGEVAAAVNANASEARARLELLHVEWLPVEICAGLCGVCKREKDVRARDPGAI